MSRVGSLFNRKTLLQITAAFFVLAGANHFLSPEFYLPLIPPYLPFPSWLNGISGLGEIIFGAGLLFPKTRRASALAIIVLLLLFIPSHVYFIQIGACVSDGLCVPLSLAHVRLWIIHPLLLFWMRMIYIWKI